MTTPINYLEIAARAEAAAQEGHKLAYSIIELPTNDKNRIKKVVAEALLAREEAAAAVLEVDSVIVKTDCRSCEWVALYESAKHAEYAIDEIDKRVTQARPYM
jgi:hypothetical protein